MITAMSRLSLKSGKHISCDHTQLAAYGARHMQQTPECSLRQSELAWLVKGNQSQKQMCLHVLHNAGQ